MFVSIQIKAKPYFDNCAAKDWLDEVIRKQEEDNLSCTIANARLSSVCAVLVTQLSRAKFERDGLEMQAWFTSMARLSREHVLRFADIKVMMLARAIDSMDCGGIAHQITGYYPHYFLTAGLELNDDMVHRSILAFTDRGFDELVKSEVNLSSKQQRVRGLHVNWPDSIKETGKTKIHTRIGREASHYIRPHISEFNVRKRRSADIEDGEDTTLISLNALTNFQDTLYELKDEINVARRNINEVLSRDEVTLHRIQDDITDEIAGRMSSEFRKLNNANDERIEQFQPANSHALIAIVILQTLTILVLAFILIRKK